MEFALFCLSEKLLQIFACIVRVLDGTIALKRLTVWVPFVSRLLSALLIKFLYV